MKITKLRLKNGYKRFHDLTLDFGPEPKRIVALVGSNGCGKSSIFDAMLFHANAHGRIGNGSHRDWRYHSLNGQPGYDYRNVEIFIDGTPFGDSHQKRVDAGKEKTVFSFRSPYRYNSDLKVKASQATSEIRLNEYGASASSDLDAKMEENYRRLYVKYNKYLNAQDCKPSEAKLKIIGDLNKSISNCLKIEISSIGDIEADEGTLFFKKPDHLTQFEFNVLSSGEKEVVDILLDLYLRSEEYNDTVYIFDEPELHLNTSIQKKLLIEIDKLVPSNCQIWIATHSIGFLRALQSELADECDIIHFEDDQEWASQSITLTPAKKTRALWQDVFGIALDDLSELVSPKRIVYCEGMDRPGANGKEKGLDANVYNLIFGEKYPDTLFVSSGGNTELDQRSEIAISIISKVLSDIEIMVLKDRDSSSGKPTSQNDREVYLSNSPDNHRMLHRWELENYLYDKLVLEAYCSHNQLTFDGDAYDELVTNIVDQNVKDETGKIKKICGISTSINAEKFKKNLAEYIKPSTTVYQELEEIIFATK
jgi:AAA15 family ATPase/GTPase